jgi:hypothetical protein
MRSDDLSPLYHLTGPCNTNLNGLEMAQNIIAPAAWSLAILKHKPEMVIEIGTSKGGLSSLLSACIDVYGGEFHTMDIHDDGDYNQYPLYGNSTFHLWDCFEHVSDIQEMILRKGRCFILCDGGNKPKEFNVFSRFLKFGDVIAAHDWCDESEPDYSPLWWGWCETHSHQLEDACKQHELMEFMDLLFHHSAWFARVKTK